MQISGHVSSIHVHIVQQLLLVPFRSEFYTFPFEVRKPSTGEIIATSANQIVPPKFRGPTKMLYYIHQTPLSSCSVEGGSGDETTLEIAQ